MSEIKNDKWKIVKDDQLGAGKLLMGYKGDTYMDAGYFFAPYVPITQTPVILSSTPSKTPNIYKKMLDEAVAEVTPTKKAKKYRSIYDPWEVSRID